MTESASCELTKQLLLSVFFLKILFLAPSSLGAEHGGAAGLRNSHISVHAPEGPAQPPLQLLRGLYFGASTTTRNVLPILSCERRGPTLVRGQRGVHLLQPVRLPFLLSSCGVGVPQSVQHAVGSLELAESDEEEAAVRDPPGDRGVHGALPGVWNIGLSVRVQRDQGQHTFEL